MIRCARSDKEGSWKSWKAHETTTLCGPDVFCVFFLNQSSTPTKVVAIDRGTDRSFQKTEVRMVKSQRFYRAKWEFLRLEPMTRGTCEGCWIWCFMSLYWFFIGLRPCKLWCETPGAPLPRLVWSSLGSHEKHLTRNFGTRHPSPFSTPWKTNILWNLKIHPIEKENHLSKFSSFGVQIVNFPGCTHEFPLMEMWQFGKPMEIYWVAPLTVPKY